MRKHLLAIAVILTVGTGCDNVAFGGIDVALKSPEPSDRASEVERAPDEATGPTNVDGPVLLAGVREGARADFVVVGEVQPDGLHYFPDIAFPEDVDRLAELANAGSEWILFSDGVRVGRMIVDSSQEAAGFCGGRTQISGVVELIPTAGAAERLLAMPAHAAGARSYEEYRAISHVYDQRVATLTMANEAIPRYGATWPAPGVLDARDHIQAFQLKNSPGESIAATFMFEDVLDIGSPGQGAYALFVLGHDRGNGYEEAYSWYRAVEAEGKGAPRYFDHLDWDGDGTDEILLDVFGADQRWFSVLSQRDGAWTRTFQDACGSGSATGN
jgi:hypothetical protein